MAMSHAFVTPEAFVAQMQGRYNYDLDENETDNKADNTDDLD